MKIDEESLKVLAAELGRWNALAGRRDLDEEVRAAFGVGAALLDADIRARARGRRQGPVRREKHPLILESPAVAKLIHALENWRYQMNEAGVVDEIVADILCLASHTILSCPARQG